MRHKTMEAIEASREPEYLSLNSDYIDLTGYDVLDKVNLLLKGVITSKSYDDYSKRWRYTIKVTAAKKYNKKGVKQDPKKILADKIVSA